MTGFDGLFTLLLMQSGDSDLSISMVMNVHMHLGRRWSYESETTSTLFNIEGT